MVAFQFFFFFFSNAVKSIMLRSPFVFTFLGRLFYFRDFALWWEIKSKVAEVRNTLETNVNLEIAIVFTVWIRRMM